MPRLCPYLAPVLRAANCASATLRGQDRMVANDDSGRLATEEAGFGLTAQLDRQETGKNQILLAGRKSKVGPCLRSRGGDRQELSLAPTRFHGVFVRKLKHFTYRHYRRANAGDRLTVEPEIAQKHKYGR